MVIDLFTRHPLNPEVEQRYSAYQASTEDDCSDSVVLAERKLKRERKPATKVSGFTWKPLKQRFERANVFFDPETQEAYSYGWWRFVERIGPYLVFNSYRYSVTTSRHQSDVGGWSAWRDEPSEWGLIPELGLKIDLAIEAPQGLQNLESAFRLYQDRIADLEAEIARKGSRKAKNAERRKAIDACLIKMATVKTLMALRDAEERKAVSRG